jgi:hypothetical protein
MQKLNSILPIKVLDYNYILAAYQKSCRGRAVKVAPVVSVNFIQPLALEMLGLQK